MTEFETFQFIMAIAGIVFTVTATWMTIRGLYNINFTNKTDWRK